jgi:UPF0716 family protein affecting phage T7 exclusion
MALTPFFIYVLPLLTVLAVALLGRTRRIGFWITLILSIFLTPIGGLIAALVSGPKRRPTDRRTQRKKAAKKS